MKRSLTLVSLLIVFAFTGLAQSEKSENPSNLSIIFDAGLLIGHIDSYYPAPFSTNISFLTKVTNRFDFGIGSGVEIIGKTFLPVFVDLRFIPIKSKPLFIYNRLGGTFCLNKNYSDTNESDNYYYYNNHPHPLNENVVTRGGFLNEIGLGVYLQKSDWKTSFSIGYNYQTTKDKVQISPKRTYENSFNRIAFRVGFWF